MCPDCGSENTVVQNEIYQECLYPKEGERCIAIVIPVGECLSCGFRWLTEDAQNAIDRAHFNAM